MDTANMMSPAGYKTLNLKPQAKLFFLYLSILKLDIKIKQQIWLKIRDTA